MKRVLAIAVAALALAGAAVADSNVTLSASDFARELAGSTNTLPGKPKMVDVHCVEAAPNQYMCSYALLRHTRRECHLMQGRWSPSTVGIVVTLAGRTSRCATLRDAIQSLR
jgi:hypothetical protein